MYKKILVPLDGSEFSECSLEDIKELTADSRGIEVTLYRVLEPFPENLSKYNIGEGIRREAMKAAEADAKGYLSKLADRLKKAGLNVKIAVSEGRPADKILDYARDSAIELIVMTTHGRSGPSRFAFGSVAEKVIRNSTVPVLSISPPGCRLAD